MAIKLLARRSTLGIVTNPIYAIRTKTPLAASLMRARLNCQLYLETASSLSLVFSVYLSLSPSLSLSLSLSSSACVAISKRTLNPSRSDNEAGGGRISWRNDTSDSLAKSGMRRIRNRADPDRDNLCNGKIIETEQAEVALSVCLPRSETYNFDPFAHRSANHTLVGASGALQLAQL